MSLHSILATLRSRSLRPRTRAARHRAAFRPRFESLEDRCLLSLTPGSSYSVGTEPQAIVAADFNNDGRLDLATANSGGNSVSVLLGNGQRHVSARRLTPLPATTRSRSRSATSTPTARSTWRRPTAAAAA